MAKQLTKLEICQRVIDKGQHKYVTAKNGRMCLDYLTASAIIKISEAIKDNEQREKFLNADWEKMANFAWKHCKLK
jgi:hypothetical protein